MPIAKSATKVPGATISRVTQRQLIDNYANAMSAVGALGFDLTVGPEKLRHAEKQLAAADSRLKRYLARRNYVASFAIGDTVKFKHGTIKKNAHFFPAKAQLLVTYAEAVSPNNMMSVSTGLIYRLNGIGWFDHDDLELVSRASHASVSKAQTFIKDEE